MFFRLLAILLVALVAVYLAGYSKTEAIDTSIEIAAPPEEVWSVLTDLESYSDWNPFIIYAAGDIRAGQKLEIALAPVADEGTMRFTPWVREVAENEHFSWLGRVGVPGIFDGHHQFTLEPTGDGGTRLTQHEDFRGLLLYFIDVHVYGPSFEAMNEAVKTRAEAAVAAKAVPAEPRMPPAPDMPAAPQTPPVAEPTAPAVETPAPEPAVPAR